MRSKTIVNSYGIEKEANKHLTLKELRKSIGATQENVAWKCKVHREAVSAWERGVKRPTRRHMTTMSKFFMVPIETIEAALEECQKKEAE